MRNVIHWMTSFSIIIIVCVFFLFYFHFFPIRKTAVLVEQSVQVRFWPRKSGGKWFLSHYFDWASTIVWPLQVRKVGIEYVWSGVFRLLFSEGWICISNPQPNCASLYSILCTNDWRFLEIWKNGAGEKRIGKESVGFISVGRWYALFGWIWRYEHMNSKYTFHPIQ